MCYQILCIVTGLWRLCTADMDALGLLTHVTMVKPRHPHHAYVAPLPALSGPSLKTIVHAVWNHIESQSVTQGSVGACIEVLQEGPDELSMERTRGGGFTP